MKVRLVVISGGLAGKEFVSEKSEFSVGRASDNAICLPDAAMSRSHARIFQRDGIWYVVDLQSARGTFHNGTVILAPAQLRPGDTIGIGNTILRFQGPDIVTPLVPPPLPIGKSTEVRAPTLHQASAPPNFRPRRKLDAHDIIQIGAFVVLAVFIIWIVFRPGLPAQQASTGRIETPMRSREDTEANPVPPIAQVQIDNVRIIPWQSPNTGQALQMVLIDWTNKGNKSITGLTATITLYDAAGRVIERIPDYYIYTSQDYGRPVFPGESFDEPVGDGHVLFPDMYGVTDRVEVQINRILH